jgi:hypothetical protein
MHGSADGSCTRWTWVQVSGCVDHKTQVFTRVEKIFVPVNITLPQQQGHIRVHAPSVCMRLENMLLLALRCVCDIANVMTCTRTDMRSTCQAQPRGKRAGSGQASSVRAAANLTCVEYVFFPASTVMATCTGPVRTSCEMTTALPPSPLPPPLPSPPAPAPSIA